MLSLNGKKKPEDVHHGDEERGGITFILIVANSEYSHQVMNLCILSLYHYVCLDSWTLGYKKDILNQIYPKFFSIHLHHGPQQTQIGRITLSSS